MTKLTIKKYQIYKAIMKKLFFILPITLFISACTNIDNSLYQYNASLASLYGDQNMNARFPNFKKGQFREEIMDVFKKDNWQYLGERKLNGTENNKLDNLIVAKKNANDCKGIILYINKGTGLDSVLPIDCSTAQKMAQEFNK